MPRKFVKLFEEMYPKELSNKAKVELIGPDKESEDYQMIRDEMANLADRITGYVSYLEQDPTAIDLHSAEEILTNTLIDVLSLNRIDPMLHNSDEFDQIKSSSKTLANMITDISPGRQDLADKIMAKYEDLQTVGLN